MPPLFYYIIADQSISSKWY